MSNKYAKARKRRYTDDHDLAFQVYDTAVQCGECYNFYNPADPKNSDNQDNVSKCPCCGGDEWVGSR